MGYDVFALAVEVTRTKAEWDKLDATSLDMIMNDADYGATWKHIQEAERHAFRQYQRALDNLRWENYLERSKTTEEALGHEL